MKKDFSLHNKKAECTALELAELLFERGLYGSVKQAKRSIIYEVEAGRLHPRVATYKDSFKYFLFSKQQAYTLIDKLNKCQRP